MELKATSLGRHLAQHPYNRVRLLHAGIEVSGEKHQYLIPYNQLISIQCRRGIVWGELEFELPGNQVVRLHGTEWQETQRFYHHLYTSWQQWSEEMSVICAQVLQTQVDAIYQAEQQDRWLKRSELAQLQQQITRTLNTLPMPAQRLVEFTCCRDNNAVCQRWLKQGERYLAVRNQRWAERMQETCHDFFQRIEASPLNPAQSRAVVSGEESVLVLAGPGSGKTSVLVARAGWLLQRQEALPQQILLLAFGRRAAQEMDERIQTRLRTAELQTRTFHALALHIIQQSSKKIPVISRLESDGALRRALLIQCWQQQCSEKKAQANGWRKWIEEELYWSLPEGEYWQDPTLVARLGSRLERWIELMRTQGGKPAEIVAQADEAVRDQLQKRLRLLAPLMKAWKSALRDEGAVDFTGLIQQAISLLEKGRFISPWKHILVDEFQDLSPLRARLLQALRAQNKQTHLFAVGDDWQAIYRFSGAELQLTTAFSHYFGDSERNDLDITYRFSQRISETTTRFILQNPHQLVKPLHSVQQGGKQALFLLPQTQLEALLNKMSGYVRPEERILILARYHYLYPELLQQAATRWPKLHIDFMTLHASKGQQADYVILLGLQEGEDGFPAPERESLLERVLLPVIEDFPAAEERRLLYVALTRARQQIWLLYDQERPSVFVRELQDLGVREQSRP